jgi:cytochrome c oxidase subunit 1
MVIAMAAGDSGESWIGTVWRRPAPTALLLHWLVGLVLALAAALAEPKVATMGFARPQHALQDTYYVAAQLHYALSLVTVFAFFAAWYYLFPKVTGRRYSEALGRLHFWLWFVGVGLLLAPGFLLPWMAPARFADYPDAFAYWNRLASLGSYLAAAGTLVFLAATFLAFFARRGRHG